ncbi:hypothetical protein DFP95_104317 [Cohnella lupini]|uniref:Uncharacterized protein n=1 Tax=Cohnella lupini TaxID=1294267 RepID=A0A3D9INI5_9BACL|nr:hypothetical protein DFP95_104317 [Cohnella lupini]
MYTTLSVVFFIHIKLFWLIVLLGHFPQEKLMVRFTGINLQLNCQLVEPNSEQLATANCSKMC